MPTYDYECDACEHRFEVFQSITSDPIDKCPKCGKKKARRLIGAGAGLIFKGSGFYCTDYKSKSYKQDESVARAKKASKEVKESAKASPSPTTEGSKKNGSSSSSSSS
ncbi:zinc ribbon domain-containing protein [bacterium]|nr:zinc ribbon domain-containing protein [bacterium]